MENTFQLAEITIAHIKSKLCNSRSHYKGKVETERYLEELFEGKISDNTFVQWLCPQIGFHNIEEFHSFLKWSKMDPQQLYHVHSRLRVPPRQAQAMIFGNNIQLSVLAGIGVLYIYEQLVLAGMKHSQKFMIDCES